MRRPIEKKKDVIVALLSGKLTIQKAAEILSCKERTIRNYRTDYLKYGLEGIEDKRRSNYRKLSKEDKENILKLKRKELWRSARNIRDYLGLKVHQKTVRRVIVGAGLGKQNLPRVKPIHTFEAPYPNSLWQVDIMGKIEFSKIGTLYLIAAIDDHSRFCLSGRWFRRQNKINVFQIWYEALSRWGIPERMLQDEGSQFKAKVRFGQADYQWYAKNLKVKLIWAKTAQCKGKIERFWRFVQDDFVRSVLEAKTLFQVNAAFRVWIARYNYTFRSEYFAGQTRAERYHPSKRRALRLELQHILTILERRRVTRQNTLSLYGMTYRVPAGYTNCRIWVKIIGNKVYLESMGKIFWKTRLKVR